MLNNYFLRPYKMVISIIIIWSFLFSSIFQGIALNDIAWAYETNDDSIEISEDRNDVRNPAFDIEKFRLPLDLGEITEIHDAGKGKKTVIHIQDAHCNYSCQDSIYKILGHLREKFGADIVSLEGGSGTYDMSLFTSIEDEDIRHKVTDYFVREGRVNGAEFYAIQNPKKITLKGLEEPNLYFKNLKVYRDSLEYKDKAKEYLSALEGYIDALKSRIFSERLIKFDKKIGSYGKEGVEFRKYLGRIFRISKESGIDIAQFGTLSRMRDVLEAEEKIDFEACNKEKDRLVGELVKKMSQFELEEIALKAIKLKKGRISESEFYVYLVKKALNLDVELEKRYPNILKFKDYISLYDSLDKVSIFEELKKLEEDIALKLCEKETQKGLFYLSRRLEVLKGLFSISLIPDDFRYFTRNRRLFSVKRFTSFIRKEAPEYNIPVELPKDISRLDVYSRKISRFYDYSYKRDEAFIERFKKHAGKEDAAVLISGGFHTENLKRLFKKEGYSYVVIIPAMEVEEDNPYFKLLAGGKSRLEERIGKKRSALAILGLFSEMNNMSDREIRDLIIAINAKIRELSGIDEAYAAPAVQPQAEDVKPSTKISRRSPSGGLQSKVDAHLADILPHIERLGSLVDTVRYKGDEALVRDIGDPERSPEIVEKYFDKIFTIQNNRHGSRIFICSGDCPMCYIDSGFQNERYRRTEPMEPADGGKIVKEALAMGFDDIHINGSDTLDDQRSFFAIVDACKNKPIRFTFNTKGLFLVRNPERAKRFFEKMKKRIGKIKYLGLGISMDPETVERLIKEDQFKDSPDEVIKALAQVIRNFSQVFPQHEWDLSQPKEKTENEMKHEVYVLANDLLIDGKKEMWDVRYAFHDEIRNATEALGDAVYTHTPNTRYNPGIHYLTGESVENGIARGRKVPRPVSVAVIYRAMKMKKHPMPCRNNPYLDMATGEVATCLTRDEYLRNKVTPGTLGEILLKPISNPRLRHLHHGSESDRIDAKTKQLEFAMAIDPEFAKEKKVSFGHIESDMFQDVDLMRRIETLFLLEDIINFTVRGMPESKEFKISNVPAEMWDILTSDEMLTAYCVYNTQYEDYAVFPRRIRWILDLYLRDQDRSIEQNRGVASLRQFLSKRVRRTRIKKVIFTTGNESPPIDMPTRAEYRRIREQEEKKREQEAERAEAMNAEDDTISPLRIVQLSPFTPQNAAPLRRSPSGMKEQEACDRFMSHYEDDLHYEASAAAELIDRLMADVREKKINPVIHLNMRLGDRFFPTNKEFLEFLQAKYGINIFVFEYEHVSRLFDATLEAKRKGGGMARPETISGIFESILGEQHKDFSGADMVLVNMKVPSRLPENFEGMIRKMRDFLSSTGPAGDKYQRFSHKLTLLEYIQGEFEICKAVFSKRCPLIMIDSSDKQYSDAQNFVWEYRNRAYEPVARINATPFCGSVLDNKTPALMPEGSGGEVKEHDDSVFAGIEWYGEYLTASRLKEETAFHEEFEKGFAEMIRGVLEGKKEFRPPDDPEVAAKVAALRLVEECLDEAGFCEQAITGSLPIMIEIDDAKGIIDDAGKKSPVYVKEEEGQDLSYTKLAAVVRIYVNTADRVFEKLTETIPDVLAEYLKGHHRRSKKSLKDSFVSLGREIAARYGYPTDDRAAAESRSAAKRTPVKKSIKEGEKPGKKPPERRSPSGAQEEDDGEEEYRPMHVKPGEIPKTPEFCAEYGFDEEQWSLLRNSGGGDLRLKPGRLYCGGAHLDSVIQSGYESIGLLQSAYVGEAERMQGKIPLTRVPHRYATNYFHKEADSPFIIAFSSEFFNKLLESGNATLEVYGGSQPYFNINEKTLKAGYINLEHPDVYRYVEEIWVDEDTYKRYEAIIDGQDDPERPVDKSLREKLIRLMNPEEPKTKHKIRCIPGLRHTRLTPSEKTVTGYALKRAEKCVGEYMMGGNEKGEDLFEKIPHFMGRRQFSRRSPSGVELSGADAQAEKILDSVLEDVRKGDLNIALEHMMNTMTEEGHDYITASKVRNILRARYPWGRMPSGSAEYDMIRQDAVVEIQLYLSRERVYQAIFELTDGGRAVTVTQIAEECGIAEDAAEEIVTGLQGSPRPRLSRTDGHIKISVQHLINTLSEKLSDIYHYEKEVLDVGQELFDKISRRFEGQDPEKARKRYLSILTKPLSHNLMGTKTYFGRNQAGLRHSVHTALSGRNAQDPSVVVNFLFMGMATGEQAYDAAAMVAEYKERTGFKGRVNIVGTDLVPYFVDIAARRVYDESNANCDDMEEDDADVTYGTRRDIGERLNSARERSRKTLNRIVAGRTGDFVRLLSAEEFADRWSIHFQWGTLDVLDEDAIGVLGSSLEVLNGYREPGESKFAGFDLVVGTIVHYVGTSFNQPGERYPKEEAFFEHARRLLCPRGVFHYNSTLLAFGHEGIPIPIDHKIDLGIFIHGQIDRKALDESDLLRKNAGRRIFKEKTGKEPIVGYSMAKSIRSALDRLHNRREKQKVIAEFLNLASQLDRSSVEGGIDRFYAAFIYLLAHEAFAGQETTEILLKGLGDKEEWGKEFIADAIEYGAQVLERAKIDLLRRETDKAYSGIPLSGAVSEGLKQTGGGKSSAEPRSTRSTKRKSPSGDKPDTSGLPRLKPEYAEYAQEFMAEFVEGLGIVDFLRSPDEYRKDVIERFNDIRGRETNEWLQPYLMLDSERAIVVFKNGRNTVHLGSSVIAYRIPLRNDRIADISEDTPETLLRKLHIPYEEYLERFEEEERIAIAARSTDHSTHLNYPSALQGMFTHMSSIEARIKHYNFGAEIPISEEVEGMFERISAILEELGDASRSFADLGALHKESKVLCLEENDFRVERLEESLETLNTIFDETDRRQELIAELTEKLPKAKVLILTAKEYLSKAVAMLQAEIDLIKKGSTHSHETTNVVHMVSDVLRGLQGGMTPIDGIPIEISKGQKSQELTLGYKANRKVVIDLEGFEGEDCDRLERYTLGGNWRSIAFSLENAIYGAINASEKSDENVTLKVDIVERNGRDFVEFLVRDYGKGIPAKEKFKISDPDFSTKARETGWAFARRAIHDIGGEVEIDSWAVGEEYEGAREKPGTDVRILWPAAPKAIQAEAGPLRGESSREPSDHTGRSAKRRSPSGIEAEIAQAGKVIEDLRVSEGQRLDAIAVIKRHEGHIEKTTRYKDRADLHVHTFKSDGDATPAEAVYEAWKNGARAIAIADHDTVDGLYEAMRAGEILEGIEVLPAIEVDMLDESLINEENEYGNFHVLAYLPDKGTADEFRRWTNSEGFRQAREALENLRRRNNNRTLRILDRFNEDNELGITLSRDDLMRYCPNGVLNYYHIGQALFGLHKREMLEKGMNAYGEVVKRHIARYKKEVDYEGQGGIPAEEMIPALARLGAVLVLAHPGEKKMYADLSRAEGIIDKYSFVEADGETILGIQGVEAHNSAHSAGVVDGINSMVDRINRGRSSNHELLITIGSDWHKIKVGIEMVLGSTKELESGNLPADTERHEIMLKDLHARLKDSPVAVSPGSRRRSPSGALFFGPEEWGEPEALTEIPEGSEYVERDGRILYITPEAKKNMAILDGFARKNAGVSEVIGFGVTKPYKFDDEITVVVDFLPPREEKTLFLDVPMRTGFLKSVNILEVRRVGLRLMKTLAGSEELFLERSDEDVVLRSNDPDLTIGLRSLMERVEDPAERRQCLELIHNCLEDISRQDLPLGLDPLSAKLKAEGSIRLKTDWDEVVAPGNCYETVHYRRRLRDMALENEARPDYAMHYHPAIDLENKIPLSPSAGDLLHFVDAGVRWHEIRCLGPAEKGHKALQVKRTFYNMDQLFYIAEPLKDIIGQVEAFEILNDPEELYKYAESILSIVTGLLDLNYHPASIVAFIYGREALRGKKKRYEDCKNIQSIRDLVLFAVFSIDPSGLLGRMSLEALRLHVELDTFTVYQKVKAAYDADPRLQAEIDEYAVRHGVRLMTLPQETDVKEIQRKYQPVNRFYTRLTLMGRNEVSEGSPPDRDDPEDPPSATTKRRRSPSGLKPEYEGYAKAFMAEFVESLDDVNFLRSPGEYRKDVMKRFRDIRKRQPDLWLQPYLMLDSDRSIVVFKNGPNTIHLGSSVIGCGVGLNNGEVADLNGALRSNGSKTLLSRLILRNEEYLERFEEEERVAIAARSAGHSEYLGYHGPLTVCLGMLLNLDRLFESNTLRPDELKNKGLRELIENTARTLDQCVDAVHNCADLANWHRNRKILSLKDLDISKESFTEMTESLTALSGAWKSRPELLEEISDKSDDADKLISELIAALDEAVAMFMAEKDLVEETSTDSPEKRNGLEVLESVLKGVQGGISTVTGKEIRITRDKQEFLIKVSGSKEYVAVIFDSDDKARLEQYTVSGNWRALAFSLENAVFGAMNASASKAEKEPGRKGKISIKIYANIVTEGGQDYLEVLIRDRANGIPKGDRFKLSDPDFSTKARETGWAFGRRVIQHAGGTLEIDSRTKGEEGYEGARINPGTDVKVRWPATPKAIQADLAPGGDPIGQPSPVKDTRRRSPSGERFTRSEVAERIGALRQDYLKYETSHERRIAEEERKHKRLARYIRVRDFELDGTRFIDIGTDDSSKIIEYKKGEDIVIGSKRFSGCSALAVYGERGDDRFMFFKHSLPSWHSSLDTIRGVVHELQGKGVSDIKVAVHGNVAAPMRADDIADELKIDRSNVVMDIKHTPDGKVDERFESRVVATSNGMMIHYPFDASPNDDRFILWGDSRVFYKAGDAAEVQRSIGARHAGNLFIRRKSPSGEADTSDHESSSVVRRSPSADDMDLPSVEEVQEVLQPRPYDHLSDRDLVDLRILAAAGREVDDHRSYSFEEKVAFLRKREGRLTDIGKRYLLDLEQAIAGHNTALIDSLSKEFPTTENPHLEYFEPVSTDLSLFQPKGHQQLAAIRIAKGCSHTCGHCAFAAGTRISGMPFNEILALLERLKDLERGSMETYLSLYRDNELLDYYDPVYDADAGDVISAILRYLPHQGVDITSRGGYLGDAIAARAIRKIAALKKDPSIRHAHLRIRFRFSVDLYDLHESSIRQYYWRCISMLRHFSGTVINFATTGDRQNAEQTERVASHIRDDARKLFRLKRQLDGSMAWASKRGRGRSLDVPREYDIGNCMIGYHVYPTGEIKHHDHRKDIKDQTHDEENFKDTGIRVWGPEAAIKIHPPKRRKKENERLNKKIDIAIDLIASELAEREIDPSKTIGAIERYLSETDAPEIDLFELAIVTAMRGKDPSGLFLPDRSLGDKEEFLHESGSEVAQGDFGRADVFPIESLEHSAMLVGTGARARRSPSGVIAEAPDQADLIRLETDASEMTADEYTRKLQELRVKTSSQVRQDQEVRILLEHDPKMWPESTRKGEEAIYASMEAFARRVGERLTLDGYKPDIVYCLDRDETLKALKESTENTVVLSLPDADKDDELMEVTNKHKVPNLVLNLPMDNKNNIEAAAVDTAHLAHIAILAQALSEEWAKKNDGSIDVMRLSKIKEDLSEAIAGMQIDDDIYKEILTDVLEKLEDPDVIYSGEIRIHLLPIDRLDIQTDSQEWYASLNALESSL
ncbi:ATP-binding protein [Candidatus Omnitrophota bacterium]